MSKWKVRHAGSPQSLEAGGPQEILDGVRDGVWEPTDEVMGPNDRDWVPMENHPQFAEAVIDYEPEPPPFRPDETRLDMNPLIDVALVLLIFFILTTTYESLRRVIEFPGSEEKAVPTVTPSKLKEQQPVIMCKATHEDGQTVYRIEGKVVPKEDLQTALVAAREELKRKWEQKAGGSISDDNFRVTMLRQVDDAVPDGDAVALEDAAKGAGVAEILDAIPAKGGGGGGE